jgi:hypothetical protein
VRGTCVAAAPFTGIASQLQTTAVLRKPLPSSGRKAPPSNAQRQAFEAFDLQIAYDKVGRRIEISATVSEGVADAFENAKAL